MAIGAIMNTATLVQTFDDEFNAFSASPDGSTGLWQTTAGNGNRSLGSNGELEYYSDSSVGVNPFSLKNGVLDITASPGTNPLNLPYNSGAITTQSSFSQLYGYFEIRAELPAGQGLWPAFWLLPADGSWPPELDIFEVLGNNPSTLYFSTHSTVQATQGTTLTVADVSAGFNTYGVMWGPSTVDLYINQVEVASMPTPADMNVPMYMLANLAVGGYWPGVPDSTTVFPAHMLIDYIHAYAYPGTIGGTVHNTPPGANVGPVALPPVISVPATLQAVAGVASAVGGVSIAANWPGGTFNVVVSDTAGLLRTNAVAGVTSSGEGTKSLILNGSLPAINSALSTLTYQGASAGQEWVWVQAKDPQGLQSQSPVVVTDTAGPAPPPVAPPPVIQPLPVVTAPTGLTLAASSTHALTGITVTSGQVGGSFAITVSDSTGLLRTTSVSGVTEQGEGSTSLTLKGNLTAINAELASLTYQAGTTAGSDWVWVSATDASGGQGIGHEVVSVSPPIVVAPPPPPPPAPAPAPPPPAPPALPVVTAPAAMTLPAGTVHALKGVSIADSNASGSFTAKISDSTGLLRTTSVSGVTEQGEGSTSLTLIGTLTAINAELSSLTYQAGKGAGSDWLWTSANDAAGVQGIGHTVVTVTPAPKVAPRGVLAVAPLTPQVVAAPIGAASPIAGQTVPTTVAPVQPSASGTQPISIQTIDVWAGGVSLVQPGSENSTFLLHDASTLNFATVVGGSGTIKFLAPTATLEVQATGPFKPAILGFAPGDTIDAAAVLHEIGTMLNFVSTDTAGTLSVSDGTHSASFALTGTYAAAGFHMAADQHGGTAITYG